MACCSSNCERRHKCAHYIDNPMEAYRGENIADYYWYGSGSISSEGCEERWWCGPHGNWGMFTPLNVELLKRYRDDLDKVIKELERGEYD